MSVNFDWKSVAEGISYFLSSLCCWLRSWVRVFSFMLCERFSSKQFSILFVSIFFVSHSALAHTHLPLAVSNKISLPRVRTRKKNRKTFRQSFCLFFCVFLIEHVAFLSFFFLTSIEPVMWCYRL